MAITKVYYSVIRTAFENGLLPKASNVLEFGEANWYGDVPPETFFNDIKLFGKNSKEQKRLEKKLSSILDKAEETQLFDAAKLFYRLFFGARNVTAIDFHGTPDSLQMDLNEPLDLDRQFDVTINNGTAEHIFNLGRFFANMHDATKPGGLMVHEGPMINGWIDHGFVNFQPTLFFDMAAANNYQIKCFFLGSIDPFQVQAFESREQVLAFAENGQLPDNPVYMTLMEKGPDNNKFIAPIQGYYAGAISREAHESWRRLR